MCNILASVEWSSSLLKSTGVQKIGSQSRQGQRDYVKELRGFFFSHLDYIEARNFLQDCKDRIAFLSLYNPLGSMQALLPRLGGGLLLPMPLWEGGKKCNTCDFERKGQLFSLWSSSDFSCALSDLFHGTSFQMKNASILLHQPF